MTNTTYAEALKQARAFIETNLTDCCAEILEWQDTALLRDGKVREAAAMLASFHDSPDEARFIEPEISRAAMRTVVRRAPVAEGDAPVGWKLVPDHQNMTDDQGEAIAKMANCCGGIAYDIYRVALESAPDAPLSPQPIADAERQVIADAARYRTFCDGGWPICFLGVEYHDKASLDAAIDAKIGQPVAARSEEQ